MLPFPFTDFDKQPDMNCAPAPTFLANSTLETYSQGRIPQASSSCMACHGNATSYLRRPPPKDAKDPNDPSRTVHESVGLYLHAGKGALRRGPGATATRPGEPR